MITVIGGSGFIGTHLIKSGNKVYPQIGNVDKVASSIPGLKTIITDIRNADICSGMFDNSKTVWCVLLAAEHRDDVSPTSLYYDVNVQGTRNVLAEMDKKGITKIIFTSSVAVYGLNKSNPDETHPTDPFNHYGKSKWQAENVLREWHQNDPNNRTLIIIRPTVVFGPSNRGNVYNLLRQIATGKFIMIGNGLNKKSMAYVENISAFIHFCIEKDLKGYHLFNYADKPDMSTKDLISQAEFSMGTKLPSIRLPYFIGLAGGYIFDIVARISGRKLSVSSVRIKKFCATTQFDSKKVLDSGYRPIKSLSEGLDITIKDIIAQTK